MGQKHSISTLLIHFNEKKAGPLEEINTSLAYSAITFEICSVAAT